LPQVAGSSVVFSAPTVVRSRGPPVFVAVERGNVLWYGELILCFGAAYRPGAGRANDAPLCLVRWLQPIAVVAQVERRALTAAEAAGSFEVYRWATHTGSYMSGHPAEACGEPNPLFRLVMDMYMCGRF